MFKRKKWKVMKPANLKEHQGGSHITFLARPQGVDERWYTDRSLFKL
jgi:hypothetical protein